MLGWHRVYTMHLMVRGLAVHAEPPRIFMDTDFRDDDNFTMHSSRGRHRKKYDQKCIMPHSVLVARSVSRSEFISNLKAMDAYWKEWDNLEKKEFYLLMI